MLCGGQDHRIRRLGQRRRRGSASGYSIVTADSLDEAVGKAKGCPVLQGGASITVYETFAVM